MRDGLERPPELAVEEHSARGLYLGCHDLSRQGETISHLGQPLHSRHSSLGPFQLAGQCCLGSLISPHMSLRPECLSFPALQAVLEEAAACCGTCCTE